MDINVNLLQQFVNFLIKKTSGGTVKNEIISNKQLAEELQKSIRKFKKRTVQSSFIDNIWSADPADTDMQLISEFNKGFRFLLCVIDIYSKYACFLPLKDKQGITITNPFQNNLHESKPSQMKYGKTKRR